MDGCMGEMGILGWAVLISQVWFPIRQGASVTPADLRYWVCFFCPLAWMYLRNSFFHRWLYHFWWFSNWVCFSYKAPDPCVSVGPFPRCWDPGTMSRARIGFVLQDCLLGPRLRHVELILNHAAKGWHDFAGCGSLPVCAFVICCPLLSTWGVPSALGLFFILLFRVHAHESVSAVGGPSVLRRMLSAWSSPGGNWVCFAYFVLLGPRYRHAGMTGDRRQFVWVCFYCAFCGHN